MKDLGKGTKATISGDPLDLGLSSQEAYSHDTKLRGETDKGQRPAATTKSVKSDRGSFKSKC